MSNSRSLPAEQSPPAAEFASGRLWDALLDDDQLDLDLDLLAAYSEGALDEPERQRVKSLIARSPRAMELLHGLHADLRTAAPATLPLTTPARPATKPTRMLSYVSWLVAAALLLALGTTYRQLQVQRERVLALGVQKRDYEQQLAALNAQRASEVAAVAAVRRERMYVLSSDRPPYMTSRGEPGNATLALAFHNRASRDIEEPSPEMQAARDAEINTALAQAEADLSGLPDDATTRLERAAQFLAAGRFDDARNLIAQMEQQTGETAAALNLRAAIDLTEAYERATPDRARQLQAAARELLQRAMQLDPQDPRAWFNLALLEEDLENHDAARAAWREYLARETDAALIKAVLDSRDL